MTRLDAGRVRWLVVHTAAREGDPSVQDIDRWHRARGWDGCGYHFVVRKDGRLEVGRSIEYQGAHVLGLNDRSIAVCLSGHGDLEPLTEAQSETLIRLAVRLHRSYGIEPDRMLGHRETAPLVSAEMRTRKTCPGVLVDMDKLREVFRAALEPWPEPEVVTRTREPRT